MDGGAPKSSASLGSMVSTTSGQIQNVALTSSFVHTTVLYASIAAADERTDGGKETTNEDEDLLPIASTLSSSGVKVSRTRVNNRFIIFELFDSCRSLSIKDVVDLFKNDTMPNRNTILFSLRYYVRPNCSQLTVKQQMATLSTQTLGNLWVIACCSIAFFISIISGNYRFYEHKLHRVEEIVLIISHAIIIFSATKLPENATSCRLIWFFLHFLYAVLFVLLLLETTHNYTMVTNSIRSSPFVGTTVSFVMILVIPAFICSWFSLFKWPDLLSDRSCWVQYDRNSGYVSLVPVLAMVVLTTIPLEASFFTSYRPLPMSSKAKMTLCNINQIGLIILFPLNVVSWLIMPFAIYTHNIPSYPIGCAVNIALGFAILSWHLASNSKSDIRTIFVLLRNWVSFHYQ
uniref:G-protein coupled receptors family 2 profile 2 domain-containing protein n=1 Tax=Romanomermis culicivorax TaxID=13658 RepID=A0A915KNR2_ROMCU